MAKNRLPDVAWLLWLFVLVSGCFVTIVGINKGSITLLIVGGALAIIAAIRAAMPN